MIRNDIENKILRPAVIKRLTEAGYHVEITHGSLHQFGFPDLLVLHKGWGTFWVELKRDNFQPLRQSQVDKFTLWTRFGAKIYIVYHESQVPDIFRTPPNWYNYWLRNNK